MQVTLFTKPNCRLCDAIKYELLDLKAEYEFFLEEVFVESGAGSHEREQTRVPYVLVEQDGQELLRFEFPVKQAELRRAIHTEMKDGSERQR